MRCSNVAAIGAVIAVSVSACGRDTGDESVASTSAELVAWANGNFSQVLRVNAGQGTGQNICKLTVPLSQAKPLTFITSDPVLGLTSSLAWKGGAVTNGTLSVDGCPTYPCNVTARFSGLGPTLTSLACNVIADNGTSSLVGTSTGNALTVFGPPTAPVLFEHSVKIGAPSAKISGSCIFRQNALLPAASVSNLTVSVNGNPEVIEPSAIPIGDDPWPTPGPLVDFGRLLVGWESGATRLRHITPRNEQVDEGAALRCGGMFFDGPTPVFDVNVTGFPAGMGVSLVRGGTGWTCGAATFGTGTGCNLGCGIPDPDCSCLTHTDCSPSMYCDAAGACVPKKPNGQTCDAHAECSSNACPSGVCCSFGSGFNRMAYFTGWNPSSVAIGDFNKDGSADLVVAASGSDNVSRFLNDGLGNFAAPTNYGVGVNPSSVAIGHFSGDTNSDLVVANRGSNTVSALLGMPGGSFSPHVPFPSGSGPASVATGDFNNDSMLDVAVANFDGDNLSVLLGTGLGTFLAPTTSGMGDGPVSVVTANFNGDNHLDIAVAITGDPMSNPLPAGTVRVLLGTGGGAFSPPTTIATGGLLPFSVTAGDFDGDAVPDLAVANYGDYWDANAVETVSVLLGTGDGTFSPPQIYSLLTNFTGAQSIAIGDFNKDGARDLVVASANNKISILLGTGTGTFSLNTPLTFTAGLIDNPGSVAVGDFNGDTGEDFVVTNFGTGEFPASGAGNTISVLYNNCLP